MVFIQIEAAAINFSPAGMRLLIKGGSYSRAAFFIIPLGIINVIDWFFRTAFQIIDI